MPKIYTKKGDLGTTQLRNHQILDKNDLRIEALGTIDELNSAIGMVRSHAVTTTLSENILQRIQHELSNAGSELGNPGSIIIEDVYVCRLEQEIDDLNTLLPPLNTFILP